MSINKPDYQILYELDRNSRATYSSIGKKLKLSKQTVKNRIDKLIANKTILSFMAIINMANFGIRPLHVFISLHKSSEEKKKEIINYLVKSPKIAQLSVCEGIYDLFFGITARNPEEVDERLSEIYSKFSEQIKSKSIVFFIDTHLYPRDYLLDKKRDLDVSNRGFHSKRNKIIKVKEDDMKILGCLGQDTRSSFVDISKKLGISVQTVINRVKFLEKNNIILGYSYLLNQDMFVQHQILLEFNSVSKELENKLNAYFSSQPNVMFVVKMLGEYDYGFIIETKDLKDYKDFVTDFKDKFSPHLKSFIPLLLTDTPKLNFTPRQD